MRSRADARRLGVPSVALAFSLSHGASRLRHPTSRSTSRRLRACAPQAIVTPRFQNCVLNTIGSVDGACTSGGATRTAHHLVEQLDAAHVNAMLIAVECGTTSECATGAPRTTTVWRHCRRALRRYLSAMPAPTGSRFDRVVLGAIRAAHRRRGRARPRPRGGA